MVQTLQDVINVMVLYELNNFELLQIRNYGIVTTNLGVNFVVLDVLFLI